MPEQPTPGKPAQDSETPSTPAPSRADLLSPAGLAGFVLRALLFTSLLLLLWWPLASSYYRLVRGLAQLVDPSELFAGFTYSLGEQGLLSGIVPFAGLLLATRRMSWRRRLAWLGGGTLVLILYHVLALLALYSPLVLSPGPVRNRGAEILMGPGRIAMPLLLWILAVQSEARRRTLSRRVVLAMSVALLAIWFFVLRPDRAGRQENLGFLYYRYGSSDRALEAYAEAARLDPSRVGPWRYLTPNLLDAGRHDEAARAAEAWSALEPGNSLPFRLAASAHKAGGRLREARTWAARAGEVDPTDAEVYLLLAELAESLPGGQRYAADSDREQAIRYYREFIALRPEDPRGWFQLGVLLEHGPQGRYAPGCEREGARRAFRNALRQDPGSVPTTLALAVSLEFNEQGLRYGSGAPLAEALSAYDLAVRLAPGDLAARRGRAALAFRMGKFDTAVEDWRRVLREDPEDETARRWLPVAEASRQVPAEKEQRPVPRQQDSAAP